MTKKSIIAKKSLFIKSHHKSTRNGARPLNTCTHHILDKRNSKPLEWGTSGQTGNSCFFDFWGEYLVNFGGNRIFFLDQKLSTINALQIHSLQLTLKNHSFPHIWFPVLLPVQKPPTSGGQKLHEIVRKDSPDHCPQHCTKVSCAYDQ